MFGSISYLPLFLQVVHGVSPTLSGVYLLPMVGGLLITSIASGQLIARTGRYKIYPIVGTAVLVVALYLLSRLDERTSTAAFSLDFFVLGFALGLIIQVLVIAVQNSADFADLGAATSGVTFFRSIGGCPCSVRSSPTGWPASWPPRCAAPPCRTGSAPRPPRPTRMC
jgi:predicted MFS family arabinose efflux permease